MGIPKETWTTRQLIVNPKQAPLFTNESGSYGRLCLNGTVRSLELDDASWTPTGPRSPNGGGPSHLHAAIAYWVAR